MDFQQIRYDHKVSYHMIRYEMGSLLSKELVKSEHSRGHLAALNHKHKEGILKKSNRDVPVISKTWPSKILGCGYLI